MLLTPLLGERYARREQTRHGRRCYQLPASIASCPRRRRFALAQVIHKRDPGLETAGYLANVG